MTHQHEFSEVVRMRGSRVRRQCSCGHIGKWQKQVHTPFLPPGVVVGTPVLTTQQDLEKLTKAKLIDTYPGVQKSWTKATMITHILRTANA